MRYVAIAILFAGCLTSAGATEAPPLVRDHSFLVQEAFERRGGAVRKVSFLDFLTGATDYEFSHEWAHESGHGFGVTVPVLSTADFAHEPESENFGVSVGDLKLSWGLFISAGEGSRVRVSPSISLLLPTGDAEEGYGAGESGAQFHLPVRVRLSERWFAETDAEATFYPPGTDYRVGQHFGYLVSPNCSLLFEGLYVTDEEGTKMFVSPGIRWGFEHPSGWQFAPGLALPVGVNTTAEDVQLLVYLSVSR